MNTVLHKDGDNFAIVTTAETERDFRDQFAGALATMIDGDRFDDDWQFHIAGWLDPAIEIVCKYRGYKSQVTERKTIIAGSIDPDSAVIAIGREVDVEPVAA